MPLYEVRCEAQYDAELSIPLAAADDPLTCPTCGAAAHRRISAPRLGRGNDPRPPHRVHPGQRPRPQVVDAVPPPPSSC